MSLRVVHTFGRNAGSSHVVTKSIVRFGRAPDNDVVFDAEYDRDASGHHAEARFESGRWILVDLNSTNGTLVRDQRVRQHSLATGDEITFGPKGPRVRVEIIEDAPRLQQSPQLSPPPPPLAPVAGKRVGQRTIAMMISSAVEAAAGRSKPSKTAEISALVDHHVDAATAPQRRTTYLLAVLLILSLGGLTGLILWSQKSTGEITELREELARLSPNDPRRRQIESRLGSLHPSNANFGRNLYDSSKKGVFMLASGSEGFCTAFAVRPTVLATSAGCIATARRKGGRLVALENEGRGQVSFPVTDMKTHPSYKPTDANSVSPDVGVITISGRTTVVLGIATSKDLAASGAGDDVYLIGFPGRLMDASNPAATFLAANLGRITSSAGRPSAYADAWLFQHDATSTEGMNGSPIFNGAGKVIAINAGVYTENDDQTIAGRKTEVVRASPYKFAMRVDLLDVILR